MTTSQAEAIRDLLIERLELFDATLDTSTGSPLWTQVVEPVFQRLGTDPFDTDIRSFLKDRISQEFPDLAAQEGDALVDLLVTPLEVLLEPLKREIEIIRRGQSVTNANQMRLSDARSYAGNFFVDWHAGSRATAVVRVYFSSPTYVNILATTRFYTPSGVNFFPTRATVVRPDVMLLQRSGTEYFVEVPVVAEEPGPSGRVPAGAITAVDGLAGYTRVTNLAPADRGLAQETGEQLLARTRQSLSERTLNVRRGIVARLREDFPSIVDVEAVGKGDPEMQRDILTGGGQGAVVASGVCLIVGQFCLLFSMFENRGQHGGQQISVGDEIELNFWKFLYDVETVDRNQTFIVDSILFDSRNAISEMPSVTLFRLDGTPAVVSPSSGSLPGVLPGVFAVVRSTGKLQISDIPGGILNPDTPRGEIEINDGEVHIGGHYDVWLRPASTVEETADFDGIRSESAFLEGVDLVVNGESGSHRHLVHRAYSLTVSVSAGTFVLGEEVSFSGGASAIIGRITAGSGSTKIVELAEMNGVAVSPGETIAGASSSASGTVSAVDSYDWDAAGAVEPGMVLYVAEGSEEGAYQILKVDGPFLYLDGPLVTTSLDQAFRVVSEVTVDLFEPKTPLVPFGGQGGADLRTTIGSSTLRTEVNLQDYGARAGDILEILEGSDRGIYTLTGFDPDIGGSAPVVSSPLSSTESGLRYRLYRASAPVQRPLVRLQPGGVSLLDPSGQDSGYRVPYGMPVGGYAKNAFSGSKEVATGLNGFVLMDPGSEWAPSDDYVVDIGSTSWLALTGTDFTGFYSKGDFRRVYTDGYLDCDGYIAVISVYNNGDVFLDSNLPSAVQAFLQDMKDWFLGVISSFNFGGDEEAFLEGLSPLRLGTPEPSLTLIEQFEICLPFALFDGCNNVLVALPEFDWQGEFSQAATFEEAINRYNNGTMVGRDPALLRAEPGDVVTLWSGNNAGSYVVDQVHQYYLAASGHIEGDTLDLEDTYKIALVVIRDQFPVKPLYGLVEFFNSPSPTWSLPSAPDLPYTVTDDHSGDEVGGWDFVEETMTWFFQWMNSLGFDLPEGVTLDVQETLKVFWEMLFTSYTVYRPTADQYIRLNFLEPTSCTVNAPVACGRYQWALPVRAAGSTEGERFTLPLPDLDGKTVSLTLRRLEEDVVLTGTLPASAGTETSVTALADILQAALDPDGAYVSVTGSSAAASGTLEVAQVVGGVDEVLYLEANGPEDAFFLLGFRESDPGKWPEITSSGTTSGLPYEVITTAAGHAIGVSIEVTLTELVHLTGTPVSGAIGFTIGEIVEGSSSAATGFLWALAHDVDGAQDPHFWVIPISGTFTTADTISGQTSTDTNALTAVDTTPTLLDTAVSSNDLAISKSFEDVAADLQTALVESLQILLRGGVTSSAYDDERWPASFVTTVDWVDNGDGSGQFEVTIFDPDYPTAIEEWQLDNATGSAYDDPHFVETYMATTSARPMVSSVSGVVTGDDYTPTVTVPSVDINRDGVDVADVDFGLDYFSAIALKADVMDLIDASNFEGAAQALNSSEAYYADGGERALLWYDTGTALAMRAMTGGASSEAATTNLSLLGFTDGTTSGTNAPRNSTAVGSTSAGTTQTAFHGGRTPTLMVGVAGSEELLFTPSQEVDPFQVFPGQNSSGDIPSTRLPRDLRVGRTYSGRASTALAFTDRTHPSPLLLGVTEGSDWVWLHEQLYLLEPPSLLSDKPARDRVPAVQTFFASNRVRLLPHTADEFTFLSPSPGLTEEESDHRVEVGDLLFIEEGDDQGGYTVVGRSEHEIELDRPLTEATLKVFRNGNDGVTALHPDDAQFSSAEANFSEDDVGRWLTIYATSHSDLDGSYEITAVAADGSSCTLDTDPFVNEETSVHWAVVASPPENPAASGTEGRTALVGLRPIRVYRGAPTRWRVAHVTPDLDRLDALVHVSLGDAEAGPRPGFKQPYRIVRPGSQRISSTAMEAQQDCGFYYFDVLAHSLGGGAAYNIPEDVRIEPVFGTYDSDGYRLETADSRLTFSTNEDTLAVFSPSMLPVGFDDRLENRVKLEGRSLRVAYDYAPTVAQVQRMVTSEMDRVLCANVLARHFLPSYVSLCVTYQGGNDPSRVATSVIEHIDGLTAVDELDVSKLEKVLHANAVTRYDHPFWVWTLTHDQDRRLVAARTENRLSDDDIPYNGTNRTTFFIAGQNFSEVESDGEAGPGERIRLTREVSTLRIR